MVKKRYHKCSCCNKKAVWLYMPSRYGKIYYCDDCVPRGCMCNVYNIKEFGGKTSNGITETIYWSDNNINEYVNGKLNENEFTKLGSHEKKYDSTYYEILDDFGRREPCCEYMYEYEGFEMEIPQVLIKKFDLLNCIAKVRNSYFLNTKNINWLSLIRFLRDNYGNEVNYNTIFDDMYKNMVDNFIINDGASAINFVIRSKRIVKNFIGEIRKRAREYKYVKYDYENNE